MKIKELHLMAFGKFHQKIVVFQDGVNWIHGENESGKTTLHKFMEGMFFGFFKDSQSRKVYSEDYDKYVPLRGRDYYGIMVVEKEGLDYRLERNFLKGKDEFKIFDDTTGEDLTPRFPYDQGLRLHIFFDPKEMNRNIFRNTISMGQLKVRTDEELAKELKERIFQFSHTGSDVSLTGALEALKHKRGEIGSLTRRGSRLGQLLEQKADLDVKLQDARQKRDRLLALAEEKAGVQGQLEALEQEEATLNDRLESLEVKKIHEKYKVYSQLKSELDQWTTFLEEQAQPFLSEEEYAQALMNHQERLRLAEEMEQAHTYVERIREELERPESGKKMEQDRQDFLQSTRSIDLMTKELEAQPPVTATNKGWIWMVTGVAALACFIAGILSRPQYQVAGWGLLVAGGVLSLVTIGLALGQRSRGKANPPSVMNGELALRLEEARRHRKALLAEYEVADEPELLDLWERELGRFHTLRSRMEYVEETLVERQDRDQLLQKTMLDMLDQWQVPHMEGLSDLYQRQKQQRRAGERIRELETTMEALMSQEEFQRLQGFFTGKASLGISKEDAQAWQLRLEQVTMDVSALRERILRLEGQMLTLEREGLDVADLEEEKIFVEKEMEDSQQRLEALALAEANIDEAARTLHREVAPRLNDSMQQHLSAITGLERALKVDPSSRLRVEDAETATMVDADYLSLGATDQLYLAFRLGIVQTLGLNEYPLLLDEAFLQFDQRRLERGLALICEQWKDRQVLLFSSHIREKNVLDALGVPYHPVLL